MKLFYDTLVPFMPDSITDDEGKLIYNEVRAAGKNAMIDLANFQNGASVSSLFHSIICACLYQEKDVVDTIINLPENIAIADGTKLDLLLDDCAKMLFQSIKPDYEFNIDLYVANLLTVAHTIMMIDMNKTNQKKEEKGKSLS